MNPILLGKIAAIVIAVLAIFFTGQKVERAKWMERELELNQQATAEHDAAIARENAISTQYEQLKAAKQTTQTNITRSLNNEIKTNSSAYACVIPLDGVRLLTQAANIANGSASQPGSAMPENRSATTK